MNYLLRSMLYVPAYNSKFITKAIESDADAIIFDFEDSCPLEKEEEGRENVRRVLESGALNGRQVFLRVNELGTTSLMKDLELLQCCGILGIMPPKVNNADDMRAFAKLVSEKETQYNLKSGSIKFTPLIETAGAIVNLDEIAMSSDRIIALTFGGEDYLDSIWGVHTEPPVAFDVPRALLVQVARKHGILPIDTPYLDLQNEAGYRHEEGISASMGFAGNLLVNPRQIPWANEVFSPSEDEVVYARRVVEAVRETLKSGGSIAVLDGKMIGPPMRKRADKVVALANLIEEFKNHNKV